MGISDKNQFYGPYGGPYGGGPYGVGPYGGGPYGEDLTEKTILKVIFSLKT